MSENLKDLYQEVILDHNKNPRNFRKLEDSNRHSVGFNPLCGDKLDLYLKMDGDKIESVGFLGSGCAISKSSASVMTTVVKGKTKKEAEELLDIFSDMVTGKKQMNDQLVEDFGSLAAFSGVSEFPARVKCASLAWHTLKAALEGQNQESVCTEKED
ncbi:MAG: SUF system NifU family Fe-S cluster assembly protein [Deltaproteobacteria bacterium]|nr:MAG: SUF system NifU family Fe-S cluster assembly protein [Deltaproteobacteria bacterium]